LIQKIYVPRNPENLKTPGTFPLFLHNVFNIGNAHHFLKSELGEKYFLACIVTHILDF
jgi:hypothetical protein